MAGAHGPGRGTRLRRVPGSRGCLWGLGRTASPTPELGRVVLLERIRGGWAPLLGLVARSMDMAGRSCLDPGGRDEPLGRPGLVSRTFGGRHGGWCCSTPAGEEAVAQVGAGGHLSAVALQTLGGGCPAVLVDILIKEQRTEPPPDWRLFGGSDDHEMMTLAVGLLFVTGMTAGPRRRKPGSSAPPPPAPKFRRFVRLSACRSLTRRPASRWTWWPWAPAPPSRSGKG